MGFISDIGEALFGDRGAGAAEAQQETTEENRQFIREFLKQTRFDIDQFAPNIAADRRVSDQAALDVFGRVVPQQVDLFQQGNVAAQRVLGQGLPQIQNALRGLPVDLGFAGAPQKFNFDPSSIQRRLPELRGAPRLGDTIQEQLRAQETQQQRNLQEALALQAQGGTIRELEGILEPGLEGQRAIDREAQLRRDQEAQLAGLRGDPRIDQTRLADLNTFTPEQIAQLLRGGR